MSDDNYTPSLASLSSRRKPSQDVTARRQMSQDASSRRQGSTDTTGRRSTDRERPIRRPSAPSVSGTSDSAGTVSAAQSATATSGMVIPNKSTMEEEYIEVPYGRDARESGSTTMDDRDRSRNPSQDVSYLGGINGDEPDSASDYPSSLSPRSPPGGLNGLSARLRGVDDEDDEGVASRSGDDFFDKSTYGRTSAASERSTGISARLNGRASVTDDTEKIRRDYEYKIATMQSQISNLQRDLDESAQRERRAYESEERVRQMEEELQSLRRVSCSLFNVTLAYANIKIAS